MEQGYKNAGGWRFGQQMPPGILGLLGQYDPYAPGQDWSKISDINVPAKPGALDAATKGKDVGALASYGGGDYGGPGQEGGMSGGAGSQSMSPGGNSMTMASPGGLNIGMNGAGKGNMPGLLGMLGMNIGKQAPVFDLDQSAITQVNQQPQDFDIGQIDVGGLMGMLGNTPANENDNGGFSTGLGDGNTSIGSDASTAEGSTDGSAYAKGGKVKGLLGMNPPGPDDGYGALDRGEFVIKKKKAKKIGDAKLEALNKGKAKVVMTNKGL